MTLPDQILLINDLIRENREATVRDYIETLKDVERVEQTADQKDHLDELAGQGLLFRSHDKMIRTPAEKYELPTHERLNRNSA